MGAGEDLSETGELDAVVLAQDLPLTFQEKNKNVLDYRNCWFY